MGENIDHYYTTNDLRIGIIKYLVEHLKNSEFKIKFAIDKLFEKQ